MCFGNPPPGCTGRLSSTSPAAAMSRSWGKLVSLTDGQQDIELTADTFVVGRGASCNLRVSDPRYSGMHCTIRRRRSFGGGETGVELLGGSANGTWLKRAAGGSATKLLKHDVREMRDGDVFSLLLEAEKVQAKFRAAAVAFRLELLTVTNSAETDVGAEVVAGPGSTNAPQFRMPAPKTRGGGGASTSSTSSSSSSLSARPRTLHGAYIVQRGPGGELGRGNFATVFRCTRRADGQAFAVKQINKKKFAFHKKFHDNLKKEVEILRKIKHANIVEVIDVYETAEELSLVTELMGGGELFDHIIDSGRLPEEQSRSIVKQILEAVRHLHHHNIIHRCAVARSRSPRFRLSSLGAAAAAAAHACART
jgi:pSer/pThr/pTyr-binding forkhead associated (FHA) protein